VLTEALVFVTLIYLDVTYIDTNRHHQWYFPTLAYVAPFVFVSHYVFIAVVRVHNRGEAGAFDLFWACNFCLLLCSVAVVFHLPSVLAAAVTVLSCEHFLFALDVVTFLVTGKFPTGAAAYLIWPATPWSEWITTSHHAWFIPMMLGLLYRSGGVPLYSFWLGACISCPLSICTRWCTPRDMIGWSRTPTVSSLPSPSSSSSSNGTTSHTASPSSPNSLDTTIRKITATRSSPPLLDTLNRLHQPDPSTVERTPTSMLFSPACNPLYADVHTHVYHYVNINMSHEVSRDVPMPWLHRFDRSPAWIYLPFLWILGNVILNGPVFLLARWLSVYVLE